MTALLTACCILVLPGWSQQDTTLIDQTSPTFFFQVPDSSRGLLPFIKRQYNRISTSDRMVIPFPILSRQPETGWLAGVGMDYYFKPRDSISAANTRPSYIYASATYSQLNQFQSDVQWQVFTPGNKWFLRGQIGFINFYDRFWGIGNQTPESELSEYTFNRTRLAMRSYYQAMKDMYAGLYLQADWYTQVNWFNKFPGLNLDTLPGSKNNRLVGFGPALLYDNRDNPYEPHKGWYIELQTTFFFPVLGSDFGFQRLNADARHFIPLGGRPNHVLALQTVWNLAAGDEIPFREMGRLGSPMIMRGYFNGRFKDRHMASYQVEYRFPVWKLVSGATFFSMGRVANRPSELLSGKFHYSYGIGPRITVNKKQRVSLRLDFAFNEFGRTEFYARFFEAF